MSARRRRRRRAAREARPGPQDFWGELNLRIKNGQVIPIISDSVRTERIFDVDYDYDLDLKTENGDRGAPDVEIADGDRHTPNLETGDGDRRAPDLEAEDGDLHAVGLNVEEELSGEWAERIGYPLVHDKHRLARVAVYNRVCCFDEEQAKTNYLRFLKDLLLEDAEQDEDKEVAELVPDLREQRESLSFSAIASQLGYPKYASADDDPLRLLARLRLPIYVTTSPHDFMERALADEGAPFKTQICFLSGAPQRIASEHRPAPGLELSCEQSVVYHLHGYEDYASSLVLSEDDYLDFLVRVSEEGKDSHLPLIPLYLSRALTESSLILLGYRLHDWDFRVVFRGLIKAKHARLRKFGLAIQLDPAEQREIKDSDKAREYLETYFQPEKFIVDWGTADSFVKRLYRRFDDWRGVSDEQDEQAE
jgi:hypothetical protein